MDIAALLSPSADAPPPSSSSSTVAGTTSVGDDGPARSHPHRHSHTYLNLAHHQTLQQTHNHHGHASHGHNNHHGHAGHGSVHSQTRSQSHSQPQNQSQSHNHNYSHSHSHGHNHSHSHGRQNQTHAPRAILAQTSTAGYSTSHQSGRSQTHPSAHSSAHPPPQQTRLPAQTVPASPLRPRPPSQHAQTEQKQQRAPNTLEQLSGRQDGSPDLATLMASVVPAAGLPADEAEAVTQLIARLDRDRTDYWAYVELIARLHQAFVARCRASRPGAPPASTPNAKTDESQGPRLPSDVSAIAVLLQKARADFSAIYTPSADMWLAWLADDVALAASQADRERLIERFKQAIALVPASVPIIVLYMRTLARWWLLNDRALTQQALDLTLADQHFAPIECAGETRYIAPFHYPETDAVRWPGHSFDSSVSAYTFTWSETMYTIHPLVGSSMGDLSREADLVFSTFSQIVGFRLAAIEAVLNGQAQMSDDRELRTEHGTLVSSVRAVFERRLRTPHISWDETASMMSNFISRFYDSGVYEATMVEVTRSAGAAKRLMAERHDFEVRVSSCADGETAIATWLEYVAWEINYGRSGITSEHGRADAEWRLRVCALYNRLLALCPIRENFWLDWLEWLHMSEREITASNEGGTAATTTSTTPSSTPVPTTMLPVTGLAVLKRASSFCPWSGALWEQYIQRLEQDGASFEAVADVKHQATISGLLERGGPEPLFKVYIAWCGFLHRRAANFSLGSKDADAREEMFDVAEVGIRSALEHVREVVKDLDANRLARLKPVSGEGADYTEPSPPFVPVIHYTGDPQLRLERIFIRFAADRGHFETIRQCYDYLAGFCGNHLEFWRQYYIFEMMAWGASAWGVPSAAVAVSPAVPRRATQVLYQAFDRLEFLDDPHGLIPSLVNHCGQYESIDVIRNATIDVQVALRRIAAIGASQQRPTQAEERPTQADERPTQTEERPSTTTKRPLESDHEMDDVESKKPRTEQTPAAFFEQAEEADGEHRDRENNSLLVANLPSTATPEAVRRFFRGCGTILSLAAVKSDGADWSAVVEFESHADALFAAARRVKPFDQSGRMLDISVAHETTLWLANYPADADETAIRELVSGHGKVAQVRFPSLAKNPHRRFCYVTMLDPTAAKATEKALDGSLIPDGSTGRELRLVCRLSDPTLKKGRVGALYDGREVIVHNWHYDATEAELRRFVIDVLADDAFSAEEAAGSVERARIPRSAGGRGKGSGFVVFTTPEYAKQAVEALSGRLFKGRPIRAEITSPDHKHSKRTATMVNSRGSTMERDSGRESVDAEMSHHDETDAITARARSITISGIPDTVSSAAVQRLVSPFGDTRKVSVRPAAGTAVIEFVHEASVGRAILGLDGTEVVGKKVAVGPGVTLRESDDKKSFGSGFVPRPRGVAGRARVRGRARIGNMRRE